MNCSSCIHYDGQWGDPMNQDKNYCRECIHNYRNLKDHYRASANTLDRELYNQLKKKFGD